METWADGYLQGIWLLYLFDILVHQYLYDIVPEAQVVHILDCS